MRRKRNRERRAVADNPEGEFQNKVRRFEMKRGDVKSKNQTSKRRNDDCLWWSPWRHRN